MPSNPRQEGKGDGREGDGEEGREQTLPSGAVLNQNCGLASQASSIPADMPD